MQYAKEAGLFDLNKTITLDETKHNIPKSYRNILADLKKEINNLAEPQSRA